MDTAADLPNAEQVLPPDRSRRGWKPLAAAGLVPLLIFGTVVIAAANLVGVSGGAADDRSAVVLGGSQAGPVFVPERPLGGQIAFTIGPGAAHAQLDGGTPYVMPPVIRLRVGDSVVVTNDDAYPHMILGALAPAGETTTITFDLPGAHAFSSGCTANGGKMNSFTSVIVSGRT